MNQDPDDLRQRSVLKGKERECIREACEDGSG